MMHRSNAWRSFEVRQRRMIEAAAKEASDDIAKGFAKLRKELVPPKATDFDYMDYSSLLQNRAYTAQTNYSAQTNYWALGAGLGLGWMLGWRDDSGWTGGDWPWI